MLPSRRVCGMAAIRVHVPPLPLLFIFCSRLSSGSQKVANPHLAHFPKWLWCKKHPLLGEDAEVFLLMTSTKKITFWPEELPEGSNPISGWSLLASPCPWDGWAGEQKAPAASRRLHPGQQRSWGCLSHPLGGVCNMCSLTVFGLLSVRAFIVPILLPL